MFCLQSHRRLEAINDYHAIYKIRRKKVCKIKHTKKVRLESIAINV